MSARLATGGYVSSLTPAGRPNRQLPGVADDAEPEAQRAGDRHPARHARDRCPGDLYPVPRAADVGDDSGGLARERIDPGVLHGGWELAHPREHGVDEDAFTAALDLIHLRLDAGAATALVDLPGRQADEHQAELVAEPRGSDAPAGRRSTGTMTITSSASASCSSR